MKVQKALSNKYLDIYKLEYFHRNNTSGNVRHRQVAKKTSNGDPVAVESTSLGSVCELSCNPKPETKYCRNKKNDFESRIVQWMENMLKISKPEPQKLDKVDHTMASMALMICHDLRVPCCLNCKNMFTILLVFV